MTLGGLTDLFDEYAVRLASVPEHPPLLDYRSGVCPECGDPDLLETGKITVDTSGATQNFEFGQTEHWWHGTVKCARCGAEAEAGDSSL